MVTMLFTACKKTISILYDVKIKTARHVKNFLPFLIAYSRSNEARNISYTKFTPNDVHLKIYFHQQSAVIATPAFKMKFISIKSKSSFKLNFTNN